MVAQKMGSQMGVTNSIGGNLIPTHDPKSHPLPRHGSLYNLTFSEMENQLGDLGKPLSSMNLDELLKKLSSAEANNNSNPSVEGGDSGVPGLQRAQPSLFSSLNRHPSIALSHDLFKKTVGEVWNIWQDQKMYCLDRSVTLGEMTLEDFLVKAGVVSENKNPKIGLSPQGAQWMSYRAPSIHPQQQPQLSMMPIFGLDHAMMESIGFPENQLSMSSSPIIGTLSDARRKCATPDIVEKSVERRQKRMIKNRESAARSRARKQAYTSELEKKISHLEEENERLKRQQEWENILPSVPPLDTMYQLRRTSSAPL